MASDRDSEPPQAPRRAPVHELDTAHEDATTLARFILSPHRHQATDRGNPTTSAMHVDTARRVLPSPFRRREHRIGPAAIPAPPPLGRQSLLPGTTCSTIKPCRALPRSSLPCEPIHATSTMQTCSACARSSSEQPGTLAARTPSSRPHGPATLGSTSRTTTARPRHTESDRCSKQSRS